MKSLGEKLYDACRLWNIADFVPWADAPSDLRTQMEKIALSFAAKLSGVESAAPEAIGRLVEAILDETRHSRGKYGPHVDGVLVSDLRQAVTHPPQDRITP